MSTTTPLDPARERMLLLTLAGIQFAHILDFMIMMPLGPVLMRSSASAPTNSACWSRPTPSRRHSPACWRRCSSTVSSASACC
jgi:hypothetical protein